jgi:molybdopterin-guanine dinucleotide biosynthesis protein A
LISCNRNEGFYASLGDAIVIDNRTDFQGPLAGLEAAAPHISSEFLVIVPCDMPLLPRDLAVRLLGALEPGTWDISYAHDGARDQYLCAAMRVAVLPSLRDFLDEGQRAVRHWYARHRYCAVDFSDQAAAFENYNRLE